MRYASLAALTFVLAQADPSLASQTYTVPFTIVPGSVYYLPPFGASPVAAAVPLSMPLAVSPAQDNDCAAATGTFTVQVVNNGLEVGLDGVAVSGTGGQCQVGGRIAFEVSFDVPETNGSTTSLYLKPSIPLFAFSQVEHIVFTLETKSINGSPPNFPTSSLLGSELRYGAELGSTLEWRANAAPIIKPVSAVPWLPGDSIKVPIVLELYFDALANDTIGKVKVRQELKVTVPEPSASLTLPIGAGTLVALAMLRGGS